MFLWGENLYVHGSVYTKKLLQIKLRKLSIFNLFLFFLDQNWLNHTHSIVYARVRASFLDNLGFMAQGLLKF